MKVKILLGLAISSRLSSIEIGKLLHAMTMQADRRYPPKSLEDLDVWAH